MLPPVHTISPSSLLKIKSTPSDITTMANWETAPQTPHKPQLKSIFKVKSSNWHADKDTLLPSLKPETSGLGDTEEDRLFSDAIGLEFTTHWEPDSALHHQLQLRLTSQTFNKSVLEEISLWLWLEINSGDGAKVSPKLPITHLHCPLNSNTQVYCANRKIPKSKKCHQLTDS